ncbi:hypothetical protein MMC21_000949 [Puttea exsequens]|nr:hypothetical protein [Puttea exsequens]
MPRQGSPSPARRPQLDQRQSSNYSLSKASPGTGHLSKSNQKGSSTRLHRPHAVAHGRQSHGRVPSYGKGLHKLTKMKPDDVEDGGDHHTRSASQTPTGSPTASNTKRNSSTVNLPRTGSKVSIKKNKSDGTLSKHGSSTKLGNQPKSEKAQTKNALRKKNTASFEIGDEDQDEEWEDSSSSPYTTRTVSARPKSPLSRDPPSPDEPPEKSPPPNLPHSPPDSPPKKHTKFIDPAKENQNHKTSHYSTLPNADDVTHRLLNRTTHSAAPQTSTISATITPNGSGSPLYRDTRGSSASTKEPSMPADGISRFLSGTGSNSGSATPGSISHLQSNLNLNNNHHHRSASPASSELSLSKSQTQTCRVKSATNLHHAKPNGSPFSPPTTTKDTTTSTPTSPPTPKRKPYPLVSPYESARGQDPTAGKSLTQLKIDLQRMSTQRDVPSSQHPLLQHGSVVGIQNLSGDGAGGDEVKARYKREHRRARAEVRNARRFCGGVVVGGLVEGRGREVVERVRVVEGRRKEGARGKAKVGTGAGARAGSSGEGRGRVRFEVGGAKEEGEEGGVGGGVRALLERMWEQGEHLSSGDE